MAKEKKMKCNVALLHQCSHVKLEVLCDCVLNVKEYKYIDPKRLCYHWLRKLDSFMFLFHEIHWKSMYHSWNN